MTQNYVLRVTVVNSSDAMLRGSELTDRTTQRHISVYRHIAPVPEVVCGMELNPERECTGR